MDFWTTIGIVSSVFGILSFLKNDSSFFKKFENLVYYTMFQKHSFVFLLGQNLLKKNNKLVI